MHRDWRLRIYEARREIVLRSFVVLSAAGRPTPSVAVAHRLGDRFSDFREQEMKLFPDAHHVLDTLKQRGARLGLVTNGASAPQRSKIKRFDLEHRSLHIQIEGEHDFGKPDDRAYAHAPRTLGVDARETWMVVDNLEWEVAAPQRLGIHAIWLDSAGKGLPRDSGVKPDRIIRALSELL
jgi:putative hydrolase of the HAD superfamily